MSMDSLGSIGAGIFQDIFSNSYKKTVSEGVARLTSNASVEETSKGMTKFANEAGYVDFSPSYLQDARNGVVAQNGNMANQIIGNIQNGMPPQEALNYGKAVQSYSQANANQLQGTEES